MFPFTKETGNGNSGNKQRKISRIWKGLNFNLRDITVGKVGTLVLNVKNRILLSDTLMNKAVILPRTSADVTERINAATI
jgi:hypothetical protein